MISSIKESHVFALNVAHTNVRMGGGQNLLTKNRFCLINNILYIKKIMKD